LPSRNDPVHEPQRLPRIVGRAMAKDLLFTGRKLPVAEAQALRFVNRIVPAGQLDAALSETLEGLLRAGPIAVRLIKQAINTGENCDRTTAIDIERQLIDQSFAHNEWRSAIEDFAAKGRS
jgi:enoyl-CoA hydratase